MRLSSLSQRRAFVPIVSRGKKDADCLYAPIVVTLNTAPSSARLEIGPSTKSLVFSCLAWLNNHPMELTRKS